MHICIYIYLYICTGICCAKYTTLMGHAHLFRSLMGGGMFVTTVVLGSVILFTNKKDCNIGKLDLN